MPFPMPSQSLVPFFRYPCPATHHKQDTPLKRWDPQLTDLLVKYTGNTKSLFNIKSHRLAPKSAPKKRPTSPSSNPSK